jgi:DNA-binding CsgD family transcriptional regulator
MERLAADGMTRAEIGRTLKISRPIVSAHLSTLSAAQAPKSLHLVKDD